MYDTGVIYAGWGVRHHMMIPPKQKEWKTIGYCAAPCAEKVSRLPSNLFLKLLLRVCPKRRLPKSANAGGTLTIDN